MESVMTNLTNYAVWFKYIVFFIPAVVAIISAKRFNFLHGVIVFGFSCIVLVGISHLFDQTWFINILGNNANNANYLAFVDNYNKAVSSLSLPLDAISLGLSKIPALATRIYTDLYWVSYVVAVVVWFICRLIAGAIKKDKEY